MLLDPSNSPYGTSSHLLLKLYGEMHGSNRCLHPHDVRGSLAPDALADVTRDARRGAKIPSSTVPLPSEVVPQWRQQVMFAVMKEPGLFIAL